MSNSVSVILALVIGLFLGIGLGTLLSRSKNRPIDTSAELAAKNSELETAKALLAEYKGQLEASAAKNESTIKLNAELEAMKARVEE